jgi:Family of unknown function (DUF6228)
VESARLDGDSNSRPASLSLFDARFEPDRMADSDAYWMECQARLDADGQTTEVAVSMIQPYREDALTFFEKLCSLPDEWLGTANWYSESGEITIDVEGQGNGLVALQVELRRMAHLEPAAAGQLMVAYDALRRFTGSLPTFFSLPSPPPDWTSPATSPLSRWSFADARPPHRV